MAERWIVAELNTSTFAPTTNPNRRKMNNEDYASYELALKLKACGFREPCDHYYTKEDAPEGTAWIVPTIDREDFNADSDCPFCKPLCSAPNLWQAQKWLREKLLLNVGVNPAIPTLKWQFYIDDLNQHINPYDGELMTRWNDDMQEKADKQFYDSYEQALSAGISAALELIKKGE